MYNLGKESCSVKNLLDQYRSDGGERLSKGLHSGKMPAMIKQVTDTYDKNTSIWEYYSISLIHLDQELPQSAMAVIK